MNVIKGDLWDEWANGRKVVVTTNVGWCPMTGRNNMGAGMAYQAMERWPDLPVWYGSVCRLLRGATPVVEHPDPERRLIFLPVKPLLDEADPERSWDQAASLILVKRGLRQLCHVQGQIALGFPGAGNGGMKPGVSLAAVRLCLHEHRVRFKIVDWKGDPDGRNKENRRAH